jgi:MoaA/NifB/PqqE/SkfB family radical SAM enzyme
LEDKSLKNWLQLIPRIVGYKFFRAFDWPKIMPFMLTVSVTNQCNSKCKTCNIWKIYNDNPLLLKDELSLNEYDSIFKNIGDSIIWYNLSGGEPFLRKDLSQICKIMYENSNPKFFTIPTNGLLPKLIIEKTKGILDYCEDVKLVLNVSVDEINSKHDEIRGVEGNFKKIVETIQGLKELKLEYKNLDLGIHSVISKYNVKNLSSVYDIITNELGPDSYICSPAQNRSELLNENEDIAPDIESYEKWVDKLQSNTKQNYMVKKGIPKLIQAVRLKYYDLAIKELKQKKQIIPCYAGYASCQITPYGDVWPCCTLAYEANMGNLRENNYNLKKIWHSEKAGIIRTGIKKGLCNCPMANIHYTNMLCNTSIMIKILSNILFQNV